MNWPNAASVRAVMLSAMTAPEPTATDVLGSVTLVTGAEELLAERAVSRVAGAVKALDPDSDVAEIRAGALEPAELAELTSPSLFASVRTVIIRDLQDASDQASAALLSFAANPADDVALVLLHTGGQKGKALLDRLRPLDAVRDVRCETPKMWQLPNFVAEEVRQGGGKIDPDAASALVDAVGTDLRSLVAAAEQLVADCAGQSVTATVVSRYFEGRAEVKGFSIADAAIDGKTAQSLEQLRWALNNAVPPVLVTSALASGLRAVARFSAAPRGLREADLSRHVGVPPWKLKAIRAQANGWTPEGLATAIRAVARADADVKGGADNAAYTLERIVMAVVAARAGRDRAELRPA